MCGRYILRMQDKYLREWDVHGPPDWLRESYNVAPTQQVPILRVRHGAPEAVLVRWGLIPFFAHGIAGKYSTINARIETFTTAAAYRGPWKLGQRCLQPAGGFYEWHQLAGGSKVPYFITLADQDVFAFAALWDRSFREDGSAVESCAHITMPGNELLTGIHNTGMHPGRMPAILRHEDQETWLRGSSAEALAVLKPYPAGLMVAYRVSTRVNSVRNDAADLIEPVAA